MHLAPDDQFGALPYTPERIAAYAEQARRAGVDEICVTEHSHRFRAFRPAMAGLLEQPVPGRPQDPAVRDWLSRDFREELDRYVAAVLDARRQGLPVRLGIEVDYVPGQEEALARALDGYPWDCVLGSVHFVDGRSIDFSPRVTWPGADVDGLYQAYFHHLARAAASGLFDCIGHVDLPKKFGARPRTFPWPAFEAFLARAAATRTAIEINTAGFRVPAGEAYPALPLLRAAVARGIGVQLGSDAHRPEDVGRDFDRALALAQQAGATALLSWERRQARLEPLPGSSLPAPGTPPA